MSGNDTNGLPGANAMGDTMEFVKNLWASMKLPGMSVPSLSPEDIDKQIADLKAVESWLQMNMSMLRSTIQALEVQSATLNALRSMGQSFANAASAATKPPAEGKPNFESPFATPFQPSPGSASASAADPTFESPFSRPAEPPRADEPAAGSFPDAAAMAAQFANPATWWNTVQEQFSNAVGQALSPPTPAPARRGAARKPTTAAKPTTKTAGKTPAKTAAKPAGARKRTPKS